MTTDIDAENDVRPMLDTTERLLWAGRPKRGVVFHGTDIFLIPFSLAWCGFALFMFVAVVSAKDVPPSPFLVIPGLFVVIGLYIVAGRFWLDAWRRKNTVYGVTNERVVIRSGGIRSSLKSLNLRTLSDITLNEKPNGEGTIMLGPQTMWDSWYRGFSMPGMPAMTPAFEGVKDAKSVFDLLRQAQRDS